MTDTTVITAKDTTKTICLAIDIEKCGDSPMNHPVLAIGTCVGTDDGEVLEKKTWCLWPFPGQVMEPRCLKEFWDPRPELLKKIASCAVPPLPALIEFNTWLNGLAERHGAGKVRILSDNPAFDIGTLDFVLCTRGIRDMPLRYLGDDTYRSITDPSEMIGGQGSQKLVDGWIGARVQHDHWPENDAEYIYWQYIGALKVRDALESKIEIILVDPPVPKN